MTFRGGKPESSEICSCACRWKTPRSASTKTRSLPSGAKGGFRRTFSLEFRGVVGRRR